MPVTPEPTHRTDQVTALIRATCADPAQLPDFWRAIAVPAAVPEREREAG